MLKERNGVCVIEKNGRLYAVSVRISRLKTSYTRPPIVSGLEPVLVFYLGLYPPANEAY